MTPAEEAAAARLSEADLTALDDPGSQPSRPHRANRPSGTRLVFPPARFLLPPATRVAFALPLRPVALFPLAGRCCACAVTTPSSPDNKTPRLPPTARRALRFASARRRFRVAARRRAASSRPARSAETAGVSIPSSTSLRSSEIRNSAYNAAPWVPVAEGWYGTSARWWLKDGEKSSMVPSSGGSSPGGAKDTSGLEVMVVVVISTVLPPAPPAAASSRARADSCWGACGRAAVKSAAVKSAAVKSAAVKSAAAKSARGGGRPSPRPGAAGPRHRPPRAWPFSSSSWPPTAAEQGSPCRGRGRLSTLPTCSSCRPCGGGGAAAACLARNRRRRM
eukprot:scaffold17748_cov85-Isochrysis_galbana.AAC.3